MSLGTMFLVSILKLDKAQQLLPHVLSHHSVSSYLEQTVNTTVSKTFQNSFVVMEDALRTAARQSRAVTSSHTGRWACLPCFVPTVDHAGQRDLSFYSGLQLDSHGN